MAEEDNNAIYVHISDLSAVETLSADDLLILSRLTSDNSIEQKEYESCKVEYSCLKQDLYSYVSATMTSDTDWRISAETQELSGKIDSMISAINTCISACVALDNCRNKVITKLDELYDFVHEHIPGGE